MKLIITPIFFLMAFFSLSQDKPQLIYVGDPMCSWCYGYAPEISKIKTEFENILDFKLLLGGLRPNGTETMAELGEFLKHHWEDVQKRSGQPFAYEILKNSSFIYDTEPACRAVVVVREMNPAIELDFFKAIQHTFYVENKNTNDSSTYLSLAKTFNLDVAEFQNKFNSQGIIQATKADFQLSAQLGATGFPTTIVVYNEKIHVVARGYATAKDVSQQIHAIID